ncbi:MAG: S9 family peptidase [Bryobacteraceae bacterium]|nr:S9 family peptidase [Bryobacteraceae bacterium]
MRTLIAGLWLASVAAAQPAALETELRRIFEKKEFAVKTFGPAAWLDGGAAYTTVENGELIRYATVSGERSVLLTAKALTPTGRTTPLKLDGYRWSSDHQRLLIFTNTRKVWRQNTRGDYWVLQPATGHLKQLGGAGEEASLFFAKFSPDGRRVGYVRGNNIYVEDLASGKITALTNNGSAKIINGMGDWVYEEELGLSDAFRWSPDSKSIAYWQFDTSGVGIFHLLDNTAATYPKLIPLPYPKAGTANSAVRLGVVAATGGKTRWLEIPGDPRENYLARMEWGGDRLRVQQLNRLQNRVDLLSADPRTGRTQRVFRDEDQAWVDLHEAHALPGGGFVWLSERDGWRRAYRVSPTGEAQALTPANVDAIQLLAVTQEHVLYLASPDNATERHLYRVPLAGGAPERLSRAPGTHSYRLAPKGDFAFHTHSSFDSAPVTDLVRLPSHETIRVLAKNDVKTSAPPAEFLKIEIAPDVSMDAWMIKPSNFDASRRYPVLVHVYGEPASVTVTNSWPGDRGHFHRALANQGYIVVSMDNRGTPAPKGRAWRKVVYGAVGELSAQDQAAGLKQLLATRSYLDPARVAVWGWSGGGSNTLNLMFRSPDLYKAGMSVAPVPDQTLYDTIYQERYMGLPQSNAEGYRRGSPYYFANGLKGKLLIVHGTGDDNVHYQGVEKLMNRLIELGKPFDLMAYPNRSHSINEGPGTSLHLHSLLARYLLEYVPAGGR